MSAIVMRLADVRTTTHAAESVGQEKRLKQRVHIASGALIFESNMTCLLFGIVAIHS